jgi:predicted PurR-regulated permease PerM
MNFQIIPIAEANIETLMASVNRVIINPLIVLLFALAVVYFLYGLTKYLLAPDNEEMRKTNKQHMLWGIFGMFIMIAVFGILNLLLKTIGVDDSKIKIQNGDYTVGKMY